MRMMLVRRLSAIQRLRNIVMGGMVLVGLLGFVEGVLVDLRVRLARNCSRYSLPRRWIDGIRVIAVVSSDGTVKDCSFVSCFGSSVVVLFVIGSVSVVVFVEIDWCRR